MGFPCPPPLLPSPEPPQPPMFFSGQRWGSWGQVPPHLQQRVAGILLEEGLRGLLPPGVCRQHLQLELPQLLQPHGQVPAHGHQALQVIQAGVVVTVLGQGQGKAQFNVPTATDAALCPALSWEDGADFAM